MKKALKIFGILALTVFAFTSCSKDDDPADNWLFTGNYEGKISYYEGAFKEDNTLLSNGTVNVTKVGNTYTFSFSVEGKDIPSITDVEIEKGKNNSAQFSIEDGTYYIKINENKLNIKYHKDGKNWSANCTRK